MGGVMKNQYYRGGEFPKKRVAWTVCRFKGGGLGKEEGDSTFEGGLIPQCIL